MAVLGSLKNGTPVSPLFAAFGPEPIATRLTLGAGTVLVTTASLYRTKVAQIRDRVPTLRHVLVVPEPDEPAPPGTSDLTALLAAASDAFATVQTAPADLAPRPFVVAGALAAVPTVTASLAADHRVSDGHAGALFLSALEDWLQRPEDL